MKIKMMNKLSRSVGRAGLKMRKYSPEILITTGIVGGVASAVMACKATTKLDDILEDSKAQIEAVNRVTESEEYSGKYTEEDKAKAINTVRVRTGIKVAKLYGPSVTLGAASIVCILAGNNIMRKRAVALAAAYATVDQSFKDYRGRVIERFGKELDKELKYNIKAEEVEKIVVDEDGTERIEKEIVETAGPEYSEYSVFYDDGCIGWTKDPEANKKFLLLQQSYANKKLQSQGYLFLNDVYELIGAPKTQAGHAVGWIYDEKNEGSGDNYVDFGIFDTHRTTARDFVNGRERVILLDFNVDGPIYDRVFRRA